MLSEACPLPAPFLMGGSFTISRVVFLFPECFTAVDKPVPRILLPADSCFPSLSKSPQFSTDPPFLTRGRGWLQGRLWDFRADSQLQHRRVWTQCGEVSYAHVSGVLGVLGKALRKGFLRKKNVFCIAWSYPGGSIAGIGYWTLENRSLTWSELPQVLVTRV